MPVSIPHYLYLGIIDMGQGHECFDIIKLARAEVEPESFPTTVTVSNHRTHVACAAANEAHARKLVNRMLDNSAASGVA